MGTLVEETGVYYVAVDGSSFVDDAPYEFTVSVNGTDAFEPGEHTITVDVPDSDEEDDA